MNAKEFNGQVDSILAPILTAAGFKKVGSVYAQERDFGQLVLLRFGGSKYANVSQFTSFMLCFRHNFLRDVWEKVPERFPAEPSGFPFRIKPSDLVSGDWQRWRYRFHLNLQEYDTVEFG